MKDCPQLKHGNASSNRVGSSLLVENIFELVSVKGGCIEGIVIE